MAFRNTSDLSEKDVISTAIRDTIPQQMFLALLLCGAIGITLMAVFKYYLLMVVLIAVVLTSVTGVTLLLRKIISTETACILPMLVLLFIYTPASWFTFDGFMGCTPYLTILFMAMVTMTYYRRFQVPLLTAYTGFVIILIVYWMITDFKNYQVAGVVNILIAYVTSYILILYFLTIIKKKSLEASGLIIDESIRDQLTGLYNRRIIDDVVASCEKKFKADQSDYSVMMLDIDSFKSINDVFGHAEGDETLVGVAGCVKQSIRSTDYPIRYGGDEYLLILPGARTEALKWIYGRIKAHAGELNHLKKPITLSMGHAMRSECVSPAELIRLADSRMYENKNSAER